MQPFIARERYVWVECELPGYEGFRAEVRQNLTQGERTTLRERLAELEEQMADLQMSHMEQARAIDERRAVATTPVESMREQAATRELLAEFAAEVERRLLEQNALIAPHVRAWNLFVLGADGEPEPVPAPQVAGPGVFDELDRPLVGWLISEVLMAYRGGKGLSAGSTRSAEQPAPGAEPTHVGPQVIDMPNTPASRRKSSGRLA